MRHWHVALSAAVGWFLLAPPALAQDTPDLGEVAKFIRWGGVFLSLFVVLGIAILLRIVHGVAAGLGRRFSSHRLLIQKLESIAQFVLYVIASSAVVGLSVRLDSTALTVIGGGLAFSVGFAMRDLVAAFIAGITIMFDRPFQVGDRVQYGGEYGDIIKIGLRSVRMNTLDHNIVTIPNNKVLTDVTSSGNYGALEMQVAMDFYIGLDQDVELACSLVEEACLTSRFCFLDNPVPVLAKQVVAQNYVAFELKARPYVLDVKYEQAFETDVHIRVQKAFRERGIQPPAVLHRQIVPDQQR
jgi:small-conductance mechanosensitive channel